MQFKEIIGQRALINKLTEIIDAGRISHAQLFFGPEGSQKLYLAIAYAQYLNCQNRQHFPDGHPSGLRADACGVCPECVKYQALAHPDLYFLYPNNKKEGQSSSESSKSSDYIEEWRTIIRENPEFCLPDWYQAMGIGNKQGIINVRDCQELLHNLSYKNFDAGYKVIIFWMAEKLYHAVAPKLLKVLEEPPAGTLFFLITEDRNQILSTILSRTQSVQIPRITDQEMVDFLQQRENLSLENAKHIAAYAHGNLCEALNLVRSSQNIHFNKDKFIEWMRLCFAWKFYEMTVFSSQIASLGREQVKDFLSHALQKIRMSMLLSAKQEDQVKLPPEELNFLLKFSPYVNMQNVPLFAAELEKAIYHVERNINLNMLMVDLSVKMTSFLRMKH